MSNAAHIGLDTATVNLACFDVQGQTYALEVAHVREIIRIVEVAPLPNAPELIEGVIDLRGAVIPVVDLAKVLGRGMGNQDLLARIVVLEFDGLVFGLWVDAATDVLSLDARRLEDVPDLASLSGYDAVRHVVRREGELPVMVLSLETLIQNVYRSALPAQAAQGESR